MPRKAAKSSGKIVCVCSAGFLCNSRVVTKFSIRSYAERERVGTALESEGNVPD
jgi:hypothetical protein